MTVSQQAQHQDPETEAAERNSAIIRFIIYICDFQIDYVYKKSILVPPKQTQQR